MRTRLLILVVAAMVGGASCNLDEEEDAGPAQDAACGGAGPNGPIDGGLIKYDVTAPWSEGNPGLPYCAALSSLFVDGRSRLVFDHGPKDSRNVTIWLDPDGNRFQYQDFPAKHIIAARDCDFVVSRHDGTGAEGTFSCADTNLHIAGSFSVNPGARATQLPLPTPSPSAAPPSEPAPTNAPTGGVCGGSAPSGEVGLGLVQFEIGGGASERGSLPYCPQFSDIDGSPRFLVFQESPDATEPEGLNLTLDPGGNRVDYYASPAPIAAVGCDVTLTRDDVSGIEGSFSCRNTTPAGRMMTGRFVVNR